MPALILEITHPTLGPHLVELLEQNRNASLTAEGQILSYYPGGPPRPEVLIFGCGSEACGYTVLGELTLEHKELRPQLAEHNGKRAEKGQLNAGEVMRWHDFTVTVRAERKPSREEWAMIEAARTSDAALLVYADWLESRGELHCAEWARLSLQKTSEANSRLASLANHVGSDFRALVARGPIERCFKSCGKRWENLALLNEPWSRSCFDCSTVTWCASSATARSLRLYGPVTLDPVTPRQPGDLIPPPRPVG